MAALSIVRINGNVTYFKENGDFDHMAGVHANTTPHKDPAHPQPQEDDMAWTEMTRTGANDNRAKMTSMEEVGELIVIKGDCYTHNSQKVQGGHKIVMSLYIHKKGGVDNHGEAAVSYDETVPTKFLPFDQYSTILSV